MRESWLIRIGALAVIIGFILPVGAISMDARPIVETTYSLAKLIRQANIPLLSLLYLVPIAMGIAVAMTFLAAHNRSQALENLVGVIAAFLFSLVSLAVGTVVTLWNLVAGGPVIFPVAGMVVLCLGYFLGATGIVLQWSQLKNSAQRFGKRAPVHPITRSAPPPTLARRANTPEAGGVPTAARRTPAAIAPAQPKEKAAPAVIGPVSSRTGRGPQACLVVLREDQPSTSRILVRKDNFAIGRARENDLQLLDLNVSRRHARLCCAQDLWFIQDLGSTCGTFVNRMPVQATRLRPGDLISIGKSQFKFAKV